MSITRTNSRKNLIDSQQSKDQKNIQNEPISSDKNDSIINSTDTSSSLESQKSDAETPEKSAPKMRAIHITGGNSESFNKLSISPRAIPRSLYLLKSPRATKSEISTTNQTASPRDEMDATQSKKESVSPEKEKDEDKDNKLASSALILSEDPINSPKTEPIIQIRRGSVSIPSRLLNGKKEELGTVISLSPRTAIATSSITSNINSILTIADSVPSIEDSSSALLQLILKSYEVNKLNSESIKALGREDTYFPVANLPKILTSLCDFPNEGLSSVSELLIALFSKELLSSEAWKIVTALINGGLIDDVGSLDFGKNDQET